MFYLLELKYFSILTDGQQAQIRKMLLVK